MWGPSPINLVQGFRFYAVFIDNYSRFSWFYPLRVKSEFYSVFVKFQVMVENLLQLKIGYFESDGGGEFVNQKLTSHLQESGI